jgi:hypothetical protein
MIQRRALPPPAGSAVSELIAIGQGLETTLLELGTWGSQFVPPSIEGASVLHVGSYALTLKTFFGPSQRRRSMRPMSYVSTMRSCKRRLKRASFMFSRARS